MVACGETEILLPVYVLVPSVQVSKVLPVVEPVAVNVALLPEQTLRSAPAFTVGNGFTVIVTALLPLQPEVPEPVTV